MKDGVESLKSKVLEAAFLVLDIGFVCWCSCILPSLLGGANANNIHHVNCIPVVQADVKAVSGPFPALGLGLACETSWIFLFFFFHDDTVL